MKIMTYLIILLSMTETQGAELFKAENSINLTQQDSMKKYEKKILIELYQKISKNKHSSINKSIYIIPKQFSSNNSSSAQKQVSNLSTYTKNSSVFLPTLNNGVTRMYKDKVVVNETIFVHQRISVKEKDRSSIKGQSQLMRKKMSLQTDNFIAQHDNKSIQATKNRLHPKSHRKVQQMQLLLLSSNNQKKLLTQNEKYEEVLRHKNFQSNKTIILLQNQLQSKQEYSEKGKIRELRNATKLRSLKNQHMIEYPLNADSKFLHFQQHETINVGRDLLKAKSKIQKIISVYNKNKMQMQERLQKMDTNLVNKTFEEMQKINIKGQQTTYTTKTRDKQLSEKQNSKEKSYLDGPRVKFMNWKMKQMPFLDLNRSQSCRLLSLYQNFKQAVPLSNGYCKVYIGQGNNGQLIGRLLKNRGWWLITEDISEAHLVWTQLPLQNQFKKLKQSEEIKFSYPCKTFKFQPTNDQKKVIKNFLKHKDCGFFKSCQGLLHSSIYYQTMLEFIFRFKQNKSVKNYMFLKDVISHHYFVRQSIIQSKNIKMINHCGYASEIGDKKNLLFHIQKYCEIMEINRQQMIPKTLHLSQSQIEDYKSDKENHQKLQQKLSVFENDEALFILKPGQQTNRGNGITIHSNKNTLIQHISSSLTTFPQDKTYLVQEYIDPLLYQNRKFDIRIWVVFANNRLWFYKEGYIRTSCKQFTTKSMNKFVHLTNDAVQKYCEDYGRYEPGNKISFAEMNKYLAKAYNYNGFYTQIYQKIKLLIKRLFQVGGLILGRSTRQFQLFGLDFLIDKNFKVWLIECNTNPSLEICCSLLNRLVPNMIQNMLSVVVDPFFPPNQRKIIRQDPFWAYQKFNMQLLLDLQLQGQYFNKIVQKNRTYYDFLRTINQFKLPSAQQLDNMIKVALETKDNVKNDDKKQSKTEQYESKCRQNSSLSLTHKTQSNIDKIENSVIYQNAQQCLDQIKKQIEQEQLNIQL